MSFGCLSLFPDPFILNLLTLSLVSHSGAAADFVTFDLVHTSTPSITTFLPPVEIKSDTHCFTEETCNPDQMKMGGLFTSCAA